jgi:polyisoprenoid-binding protein YceI
MLRLLSFAAAAASLFCVAPTKAATHTVALEPRSAQVTFRAYGFGIVPIQGSFTRFNGALILDPANPATCEVNVQAETASLAMPEVGMTQDALGPELLDVTRHPVFAYSGRCEDGQVRGTLLLHGIRRPLALTVTLERDRWIATGRMRRAEWGMGARPLLAGPEVRIQFTATLPAGFPAKP